jgi:hypothetical protein
MVTAVARIKVPPCGLTDWRFSCEPQRLRGATEAPKFQCRTLPKVGWNALWLVSCNRLLGCVPHCDEIRFAAVRRW